MEITRVQNQTKLQRTQLNRLKERILHKNEAINRTVNQQGGKGSDAQPPRREGVGPQPEFTIAQVKSSVEAAEHALEGLQQELEEAQYDDRTAYYQEIEEELKATYLEYERLKQEVIESREDAGKCEAKLKAADFRASNENMQSLNRSIDQVKAFNRSLRDKWYAYHVKMEKMKIETRIAENRGKGREAEETLVAATEEYNDEVDKVNELTDQLDQDDAVFRENADKLREIIDNQRRRIVEHLIGQQHEDEAA
jgi:predicted phage tail protein